MRKGWFRQHQPAPGKGSPRHEVKRTSQECKRRRCWSFQVRSKATRRAHRPTSQMGKLRPPRSGKPRFWGTSPAWASLSSYPRGTGMLGLGCSGAGPDLPALGGRWPGHSVLQGSLKQPQRAASLQLLRSHLAPPACGPAHRNLPGAAKGPTVPLPVGRRRPRTALSSFFHFLWLFLFLLRVTFSFPCFLPPFPLPPFLLFPLSFIFFNQIVVLPFILSFSQYLCARNSSKHWGIRQRRTFILVEEDGFQSFLPPPTVAIHFTSLFSKHRHIHMHIHETETHFTKNSTYLVDCQHLQRWPGNLLSSKANFARLVAVTEYMILKIWVGGGEKRKLKELGSILR